MPDIIEGIDDERNTEPFCDIMRLKEALCKLAEYENLEEQGRLVKLPCKIGDTVWYVGTDCDEENCIDYDDCCYRGCEKINTPKIKSTVINHFIIYGDECDTMHGIDKNGFYLRYIGKNVFFTREEAEQELKDRIKKKSNGMK